MREWESESEYSILAGLVAQLVYQHSKANIVVTGRLNILSATFKDLEK